MSSEKEKYPSAWTPLHIAVFRHEFANTRRLANSSSVNQEDDQMWTPVHLACASTTSLIFHSHQVSRRPHFPESFNFKTLQKQPDRGVDYSNDDGNERATAMGILEILLEHNPILIRQGSRSAFPTPLHCAANSGWLSHARVLVEAGAPVYTGPDCSPLCWVDPSLKGDQSVGLYFRKLLGERGLAMIEADHVGQRWGRDEANIRHKGLHNANMGELLLQLRRRTRQTSMLDLLGNDAAGSLLDESPQSASDDFEMNFGASRSAERVMSRPSVDSNGLCETCAGISFRDLFRQKGYFHMHSASQLFQSAEHCTFCKIIYDVLNEDDKLLKNKGSQIVIRISNGRQRHRGTCMDPPIIRALEFKLSAGCTCRSMNHRDEPLDFSKCRGTCGGIEVEVGIFADNETKIDIPMELDNDKFYDATWTIQEGIQIEPDPLSPASVNIIQKWLTDCSTKHQHCKRFRDPQSLQSSSETRNSPLPTRLIDVNSADGTSIRLYDGSEKYGKYIALSHRWVSGPMPQWVTTHDSLESRHSWFSIHELPASIADAIRVTRKLGLQYIWVDSLCIIQDSREDWEIESSQMAGIYANAHLTLFADCGLDDDHGFLFPRETFPISTVTLPTRDGNTVKLNLRRSSSTSFKSVQFSVFQQNVHASFLSERGWIFQERVLSRRILHFGKDQMFWECNEGTFSEDGFVVLKKGQKECGQRELPFSKLAYNLVLDDPTPLAQELLTSQWERLINEYSRLSLTKGEDKLPALSGLASAFHSRAKSDEYIAGMWRASLPQQLAWSITNQKPEKAHKFFQIWNRGYDDCGGRIETDDTFVHSSQLFPRPKTYQAPSFSWAAVDGEIEFHKIPKTSARVESINLNIATHNPYGTVRDCSLLISGPLLQAWSCGPLKQDMGGWISPLKKGYIPLYHDDWPFGYMLPDSKDDLEIQDVFCFKLGEYSPPSGIFLVLLPVSIQGEAGIQQFRRIGMGHTVGQKTDFFADTEVKTIKLI